MATPDLTRKFRAVIVENELSGNLAYALKFSDPDGVRSGKSGWSFGVCQYDVENNPAASLCLAECGLTLAEIAGVKGQTIDVHQFEPRLKAHADVIEKWDNRQLAYCISHALAILTKYGITPADDKALLAVADYANQYGLSDADKPGNLVHYLHVLSHPFTAEDALAFKLDFTKYGKAQPDDCKRRYLNLCRVMAEAA